MTAGTSPGTASGKHGPPRFDETLDGWVVTRYADAHRVLHDSDAFSASAYDRLEPDVSGSHVFFLADDPMRERLRQAFARAMTRMLVESGTAGVLAPIARSVVDSHAGDSTIDPVEDLARPYARAALVAITGVESDSADTLVVALRKAHRHFAAEGMGSTNGWAATHIAWEVAAEALVGPGATPWSLRAQLQTGGGLTASEQVACLLPLFETVAVKAHRDLPVSLIRRLAELPADRQQSLLDEGLLLAAAEETVRLQPGALLPRTAMRDVEIGGVRVATGDLVLVSLRDTSTDPHEFSCPHAFDPGRDDLSRHQGFGVGSRVCIGRRLAKTLAVCLAEQTLQTWELATIAGSPRIAVSPRSR